MNGNDSRYDLFDLWIFDAMKRKEKKKKGRKIHGVPWTTQRKTQWGLSKCGNKSHLQAFTIEIKSSVRDE